MGEIIFHVVLMSIMGVFLNESFKINTSRVTDTVGPAGFPQIIIILSMILITISLISTIRKNKGKLFKGEKVKELNAAFLLLLVSIILFILLVNYIGFFISTFALVGAILYALGQRIIKKVLILSSTAAIAYTLVFGKLLSVPLPRGLGVFKIMSYFIY